MRGTTLYTYRGHHDRIYSVAWSPNGQYLASCSYDQTLQVWNATTGTPLAHHRFPGGYPTHLAWSPDSHLLATDGEFQFGDEIVPVQVIHALSGESIFVYEGHTDPISALAWSPDGRTIASGSEDQTIQIWDAQTGVRQLQYDGHENDPVSTLAWSPDGSHIASVGKDDSIIQIWNANTGTEIARYEGIYHMLHSLCWSPDGKALASAGDDGILRVQDVQTGTLLFTYKGHAHDRGNIWSVAWSPDGNVLASASDDTTVQLCDAKDGQHLYTYTGHAGSQWVRSLAWSPDSTRIASGDYILTERSTTGTVRIWEAV